MAETPSFRYENVTVNIEPITPYLGVRIEGFDLGDLSAGRAELLEEMFFKHRVLVFRDQDLDRDAHKAVGRVFGELHVHPSKKAFASKGDPEIFKVRAQADTIKVNGGRWHMDVSCDENPPAASILRLLELPPQGGDTVFCDMNRAFETLSEPLQRMLTELNACHDGQRDLRWYGLTPDSGQTYPSWVHPVVTAHPVSGRPVLFVNEGFTEKLVGMSSDESRAILAMLFDHVARNAGLQCRVTWEPGTVVMWDNRAVQHFAVHDYAPHARLGERVSIVGQGPPEAWGRTTSAARWPRAAEG